MSQGKNIDKKAVVLLSGGLDSAVTAVIAKEQGYEIYALTVDYGQRSRAELKAASLLAQSMDAQHILMKVELDKIGGSALTDMGIDVPSEEIDGVPITYVPARNLIFLSLALSWAEVLGGQAIFIGANVKDYSGYPDCRADFLNSFQKTGMLGTKKETQVSIEAPILNMSKAKIVKEGHRLGLDFKLTSSCYSPLEDGSACGKCASCILRKKGFEEAGLEDL